MKFAGITSIITSFFVFLASTPLALVPDLSTELEMFFTAGIFSSFCLLINGIAMVNAANKMHSMQRKITYLSGAIRAGYDREE